MQTLGRYWALVAVVVFLAASHSAEAQQRGLFQALFGSKTVSASQESPATNPGKSVEIDLTAQKLIARQGNRVVFRTRISSGRNRATPTGRYRAGPYKSKTHYSSLYQNAPMPYSVQVTGHIFIHGFSVVPDYPASHGCIRLPISGGNPARRFYNWCDVGTPIWIHY